MRWFKPNLRGIIHAIVAASCSSVPAEAVPKVGIEDIRSSMLALMAGAGDDLSPHVTRRIRHAADVQALWFLRGDLMTVLASSQGESAALEKIEAVSEMFRDLLPHGLRSRPSPPHPASKN